MELVSTLRLSCWGMRSTVGDVGILMWDAQLRCGGVALIGSRTMRPKAHGQAKRLVTTRAMSKGSMP